MDRAYHATASRSKVSLRGLADAAITILSLGSNKIIRAANLSPRFLVIAFVINECLGLIRLIALMSAV